MTEILTESFCERCGTRYTFESARPKTRLKGVKVLSRGLKNFVLSDDTSMDEAMAAARSETDREASAHQLDAFHKTFSFCMSCRQYTCPNCWNDAEARCLSCAPLAIPEPAAFSRAPFHFSDPAPVAPDAMPPLAEAPESSQPYDDLRALRDAVLLDESELEPANGAHVEPADLTWSEGAAAADEAGDTAEAGEVSVAAADSVADMDATAREPFGSEPSGTFAAAETPALEAAAIEADAVAEPPMLADEDIAALEGSSAPDDAAGKAASQTLGLLRRFRPGQSLDDELAAFERQRDELASTEAVAQPVSTGEEPTVAGATGEPPASEPLMAGESVDAPELEVQATPAAPEPEVMPEAAAAAAEPGPAATEEEITPAGVAPVDDVVEQPTWRITAPDATTGAPHAIPDTGGQVPLQASASQPEPPNGEPQWPARPEWPSSTPAAGLPYLGRPAAPQGGIDALWAASNQELVSAPQPVGKVATANSIQPCVSCGLSLSATARFCRRCGTLQAR